MASSLGAAMPLLNLLFILTELLLDLVDGLIDGAHQALGLVVGHEIVLMLSCNLEVDARICFIFEVDDDFDGREPIENPQQFFHFGSNFLLRGFAKLTVSRGNLCLHQSGPRGFACRLHCLGNELHSRTNGLF